MSHMSKNLVPVFVQYHNILSISAKRRLHIAIWIAVSISAQLYCTLSHAVSQAKQFPGAQMRSDKYFDVDMITLFAKCNEFNSFIVTMDKTYKHDADFCANCQLKSLQGYSIINTS